MKKIFIVVIVIIILLIIGGIGGYFYYDKNIRYGKPVKDEFSSPTDNYFSKILRKRTLTFWNPNGNFQVNIFSFPDANMAESQLKNKEKIYTDPRNGIKIDKMISGYPAVIVKFTENSNLFMVRVDDKILYVSTDRSLEGGESFVKWFIRYWL